MHSAHDAYKKMPYDGGTLSYGGKVGTCLYHVLPFIEQQNIWNLGPASAGANVINAYISPLDSSAPTYMVGSLGGTNGAGHGQVFNATLGASNT